MAPTEACLHFIPDLSPFIDGELTAARRVEVERHLGVCKDCTMRTADLRAESGLVRVGMEMAADEADFKDFAVKVMARLTPYKPPLSERLRLSLSELFLYQRRTLLTVMGTAAVVLLVAVPVALRERTPLGYGSATLMVESVDPSEQAKVAPVVMTTEGGDAIIWFVDQHDHRAVPGDEEEDGSDEDYKSGKRKLETDKRPHGGEL